jgi:hypothetical protein
MSADLIPRDGDRRGRIEGRHGGCFAPFNRICSGHGVGTVPLRHPLADRAQPSGGAKARAFDRGQLICAHRGDCCELLFHHGRALGKAIGLSVRLLADEEISPAAVEA